VPQLFGPVTVWKGSAHFSKKAGIPVLRIRRAVTVALAFAELMVLLVALTKPAYGYVDPGSGLLAVQVGGSMLAGGLFILRSKIRQLFRLSSSEPPADVKETTQPEAGE
jgi:hypothetical protein